jgi:hypothetical protein
MSLTLERRLADSFVPALRRAAFDALVISSRTTLSLDGGFLKIDLREPRRELGCLAACASPRSPACSE